mmetsp:Transcript_32217/g.103394  ORF Transcript_32217/g.103394 Transcript_32217/m.103394 type:complete len:303 (+) Transcript_32217:868-1776(+)
MATDAASPCRSSSRCRRADGRIALHSSAGGSVCRKGIEKGRRPLKRASTALPSGPHEGWYRVPAGRRSLCTAPTPSGAPCSEREAQLALSARQAERERVVPLAGGSSWSAEPIADRSTACEKCSSTLASGGSSSAPGAAGSSRGDHEPLVAAAAAAEETSPARMVRPGVVKRRGKPSAATRRPSYDVSPGLTPTERCRSVGQRSSGSKRAIEVVAQRTDPATGGERRNGFSDSGSWPGPQSDPSAMTACVKVIVSGCTPKSLTVGVVAPTAADEAEGVNAATRMLSAGVARATMASMCMRGL